MTTYRIMTLNMWNDSISIIGDDRFSCRIQAIREMIRVHRPDLIGMQEVTANMRPYLASFLPQYGISGESRHSSIADETCAILYRKDRFRLRREKTFWLSETPEVRGSRFPRSQFPRIASFALLEDTDSGNVLSFFNTHLDLNFSSVRSSQAKVLAGLIHEYQEGLFTAVTGDFNDVPDSPALKALQQENLKDTSINALGSTLRGRSGSLMVRNRPVDHILISRHITPGKLTKITEKYSGYWPSDHYPLLLEFSL